MGAGIGQAFSAIFNTVASEVSASQKDEVAKTQKAKAAELEAQANGLRPENPLNDPEYRMKAWLASAGLPGYEQYKTGFGSDEANAIARASKMTNNGGGLLNFLAASEAQKNKSETALNSQNAGFVEGKQLDLATTYGTEKNNFDQIAREEKAKLNYAATTYENAALKETQTAEDQRLGAMSNLVSSGSSIVGGMSQGQSGSIPSFLAGGTGGGNTSGQPSMQETYDWLQQGLSATQ